MLVEVEGIPSPGTRIVKHGPPDDMQTELDAWASCRPEGLRNDVVLMTVEGRWDGGELVSLVYDDAQQAIGVDQTVALEDAMLDAVLFGNPSVASVRQVLFAVYERLGQLLYRVSYDDRGREPGQREVPADERHFVIRRLWESLQRWDIRLRLPRGGRQPEFPREPFPHAIGIRNEVRDFELTDPPVLFTDPVNYLAYVKALTTWFVPRGEVDGTDNRLWHPLPPTFPGGANDRPADLIPILRRGRAHGDLHGRNVLVGIVHDEALWPAVYDFEHMRPDNLIAWDFVKLETELKLRALNRIFPRTPMGLFHPMAMTFEDGLNRWTMHCDNGQRWPRPDELPATLPVGVPGRRADDSRVAEPLARLRNILLEIRHRAGVHLRYRADAPFEWFRQYLFLLMCYGVSSVRFTTLGLQELTAAYVSAGVAAEWLNRREWSRLNAD
jgi:hypothetical protein